MAVGVITTFPPNTELPPGNTTNGPVSLPGVTYTYASTTLANTFSALQSYNVNCFALNGSVTGHLTINAAATALGTITLPAGTTDFSVTGGPSQVVKQTTVGGPFTVAQLTYADIQRTQQIKTTAGGVTVANTDELIVLNKTVGAATSVTLPLAANKLGPVQVADFKGDAGTNNITVNRSGGDVFPGGLTSWVIAADGASATFSPLSDGSGWVVK